MVMATPLVPHQAALADHATMTLTPENHPPDRPQLRSPCPLTIALAAHLSLQLQHAHEVVPHLSGEKGPERLCTVVLHLVVVGHPLISMALHDNQAMTLAPATFPPGPAAPTKTLILHPSNHALHSALTTAPRQRTRERSASRSTSTTCPPSFPAANSFPAAWIRRRRNGWLNWRRTRRSCWRRLRISRSRRGLG